MAKRNGGAKAQGQAADHPPASSPQQASGNGGNRPVFEVRMGRIRASVWLNVNSKQEVWYSTVLTRGYKTEKGEWKISHSLGLDDLLIAGEALKQAALWIYAERQGEHRATQAASGPNDAQEGYGEPVIPF